jgi:hypothetical protein
MVRAFKRVTNRLSRRRFLGTKRSRRCRTYSKLERFSERHCAQSDHDTC